MLNNDPGDILDTLDPLTDDSSLEHVARVVYYATALVVRNAHKLDTAWLRDRVEHWAFQASTMSDGLRGMVRDCIAAEVRRQVAAAIRASMEVAA